jgi:hypothetical protein
VTIMRITQRNDCDASHSCANLCNSSVSLGGSYCRYGAGALIQAARSAITRSAMPLNPW